MKLDAQMIESLEIIWNYMVLNMKIEKSDLIIGCGCKDLEIPKKCSELLKQGYADRILFTGGFGKITSTVFKKAESEIYRDIAIENGVDPNKIFIENQSTNTGDNFRFALNVIKQNNIKYDKIILVHNNMSQRRTLSTAKAIIKGKDIRITSPTKTFKDFIILLNNKNDEDTKNIISVIVGDIQRIIIFPQLGWQLPNDIPDDIIRSYYLLKNKGYDKYIFTKDEIQNLIDKNGIIEGQVANYFN